VRRAPVAGDDGRQFCLSVDAPGRVRPPLMPAVSEIVLCKVVRITPRVANLEIMCTAGGAVVLQEACSGIIRKEDIRQFDKDSVQMFKCMRPGDVVKARVLSLGDSRSYYLSTAETELGVILARSSAGATMVPLTFEEMQCPRTQTREHRKVALVRDSRPADELAVAPS
jgi:exosome complex component CSL4